MDKTGMRILSFFLILMLTIGAAGNAGAQTGYPESAHPYESDSDITWSYTYPGQAAALKIRFSEDTMTEENYDYLMITDANADTQEYSGDQLQGKELYLAGNHFSIRLVSDDSYEYYGFSIDSITGLTESEYEEYLNRPRFIVEDGIIWGYSGDPDVIVPEKIDGITITGIGSNAFENSEITSISLPATVTYIGYSAFSGCTKLSSVHIPQGVESIKDSAFRDCSQLTEVDLPDTVVEIGKAVFYNCTKLNAVVLSDAIQTIGDYTFYNCYQLAQIELPENLESIGNYAFFKCMQLNAPVLPEGLLRIGNAAFYKCKGMTTIDFPEGLESIGYSAFYGCAQLKSVELPENLQSLGNRAFYKCEQLTSVKYTLYDVEEAVFYGCSGLTELEFPEYMGSIGKSAFYGCSSLSEVEILWLEHIGAYAFDQCKSIEQFVVSARVTGIEEQAFDRDTVLCVIEGTYAQQYAVENGYDYILNSDIDVEHISNHDVVDRMVEEKVKWVVENYTTPDMSEYDRALALYDWLCLNVAYDYYGYITGTSTSPYGMGGAGALLGGTAVCDGYAEAYRMLLEEAGIRAEYVVGYARYNEESHAWNLAVIDGEWYQFDATWDESGNGTEHDYFGLTDNAMETDHCREDKLNIQCHSWEVNYKYKNGQYDSSLSELRAGIEAYIASGVYEGSVSSSRSWGKADAAMLMDIVELGTVWSIDGWADLNPIDNYSYSFVFYPEEKPAEEVGILGETEKFHEMHYMYPGYSVQLFPYTVPEGIPVSFHSSDETVVSVTEDGWVTAHQQGVSTVSLMTKNRTYSIGIYVRELNSSSFSLWLDGGKRDLDIGETVQTKCYLQSLLMDDRKVQYSSDDESIAVVDNNGLISAVGYGKTKIRGRWHGEEKTCEIFVRKPVRGVQIEAEIFDIMPPYKQTRIEVKIDTDDQVAYYQNYGGMARWSSSNNDVFEDMRRNIGNLAGGYYYRIVRCFMPHEPGVSLITATAEDGSGASDTALVYVHGETILRLPKALKEIGEEAFMGNTVEEFILPDGAKTIGSRAFADCVNLKLIHLPGSLTEIADDAFEGCEDVKAIVKGGSYAEQYVIRQGMRYDILPQ